MAASMEASLLTLGFSPEGRGCRVEGLLVILLLGEGEELELSSARSLGSSILSSALELNPSPTSRRGRGVHKPKDLELKATDSVHTEHKGAARSGVLSCATALLLRSVEENRKLTNPAIELDSEMSFRIGG
ncbi:hypothetical protein CC1G_09411 [Coprinopsis cinerea okayama7|uniref:Uncharacterized protein n=1 Tax=Coprinopsis cinerea (strain Okayama-7 / 130 / ATCC MYA-4618 / FGSC 9003) TaxID=240176 RepID=A8NIH6_COPC7|nr:hypothetical protein CC1G_09411 [Coprinopsis cinerea okayama7\|eukprot:XP_001833997.2 hypothetical protein CC1G_09411 [Coprinopsis cinerea okayama7\